MSLAIIVPYRDREEHLKIFVPYMNQYLPEDELIIVDQADNKPFNRGRLLNIGALNTLSDYLVFHDIDMLPIKVGYNERDGVTQIAFSEIQLINYLGGVTMFDKPTFKKSQGFHNDFFHRAEDNEMMFNLRSKKIPVLNRFGIFKQLPHERNSPEFIPELWEKAQLPRTVNMIQTCEYELISKEKKEGYTHIKVKL